MMRAASWWALGTAPGSCAPAWIGQAATTAAITNDAARPGALSVGPRGDCRDRDPLLPDADRLSRHLGCEPVGTHADRADHAACDGGRAAQVSEHAARVLAIKDVLAGKRAEEVPEVGSKLRSEFQPLFFGRQRLVIATDLTVRRRASPD